MAKHDYVVEVYLDVSVECACEDICDCDCEDIEERIVEETYAELKREGTYPKDIGELIER